MWNNEMIKAAETLVEKYKDVGIAAIKLAADKRFSKEINDDPHAFLEGLYSFRITSK